MVKLLTAEDIAAVVGMAPRTVREKVATRPGFPAPLVISGSKRWVESEIDEWLLQQRAKPTKKAGRPRSTQPSS